MTRAIRLSIDHFYIVVVIGALFVAGYGLYHALNAPSVLHYSQAEYQADKPIYAPGETLIYTPTLTVGKSGRVDVLRTFWDRTRDESAILCGGEAAPVTEIARNLPPGVVGDVRGGRAVRVVIPPLPPGDYWLISSANGPGAAQGVYTVAFRVERACS